MMLVSFGVEAKLSHPDQTAERRAEVAKGQHPFAVIVSCSDSRVPPEIIFDQGLGDLFVIRLAGSLVKAIRPAVDIVKNQPGDLLDNAVRANVIMVVRQLKSSGPILKELVEKGDLTVVGARYDLDDGVVEILP